MSINSCDISVSMLLNLLLANIRILLCFCLFLFAFFFFLLCLVIFFTIPIVREKINLKLAPAIPIGAPATLAEEIIQTPPLIALKTIKILSM